MPVSLIGTPVTTSRQWTTALAPRVGGGWNFITQSYNFPTNVPTEWVVVHLEDGTYDIYLGPNAVYSNTNFQIPSVESAITTNNQLRAPDGTIFFIGVIDPPTIYLAYYDPADEEVKQITGTGMPAGNSFLYSAIFNHDGSKLYCGTQADGTSRPSVIEIDTATKSIDYIGSGGSLTPGFPNYAHSLAKDEGPGADWLYFARGQAGWDLVALEISTGIATILLSTTGPGFQFIQVGGDATSCGAIVYNDGNPTNYYLYDGGFSLTPPGTPRDCRPYTNPLEHPPEINWTHGIGQVLYKLPTHYTVLTPTTAEWTTLLADFPTWSAPSSIWQLQGAGPNLPDTGGAGRNMIAHGTFPIEYDQDLPLWIDRKAVRLTEAQSNWFTATIPDASGGPQLALFYIQLDDVPLSLRSLVETPDTFLQVNSTPNILISANTTTVGTANPGTTLTRPYWTQGGAGAPANVVTDQEALSAVPFVGGGTDLNIGGGPGGGTTARAYYLYGVFWQGAAALRMVSEMQAVQSALGWDNPVITPDWVEVDYEVANASPIVLESLVTLPSGDSLTNAVQYCGFANLLDWHGAWPGGPSQPKTLRIDNLIYLCGYPDGVLYRYDETVPWAPNGSESGNPSHLGSFSSGADQGMKYPYFIKHNDINGRIYSAGRRERDHDGSSVGWYKIVDDEFSTPQNAAPLDEYTAPSGLALSPTLGLMAFSGRLFVDSVLTEAQILVYDLELNLVDQWDVDAGMRDTGNLYNTSTPAVIMGLGLTADDRSLLYQINITTGAVGLTRDISAFDVGPSQQVSPSLVYIVLSDDLYTLNTDTLETTFVIAIGFTPSYIARVGGGIRFYLTLGTDLYLLRGESDMNQFVPLPAPAGNGSGAAVDVSSFGPPKTVIVSGSWVLTAPTIVIEMNNDDAHDGGWAPVTLIQGSGVRQIVCAARFMRATVQNYTGGQAPIVNIGGNDIGCEFVEVAPPTSNGHGAAVDISSLAELKTIWVGNDFTGSLDIEISCDTGGLYWGTVASFSNPGQKTITQAFAKWVRVTRSGVITADVPIVNIGGAPA